MGKYAEWEHLRPITLTSSFSLMGKKRVQRANCDESVIVFYWQKKSNNDYRYYSVSPMISSPCQGISDTASFCIKWQTGKKNLNSLKATAQKDLLRKGSKQSGTQTNKLCLKRSLLIGIAKIIYLLVAWTLLQDLCKNKSNTGHAKRIT